MLTLLFLMTTTTAIFLALRYRVSRANPGNGHLSSARKYREITRRYRKEHSLTN